MKKRKVIDLSVGDTFGFYLTKIKDYPMEASISLSDILYKDEFRKVVLINFKFDMAYMVKTSLHLKNVHVDIVHGLGLDGNESIKDDCAKLGMRCVRVHCPKLPIPYGVHHGKMMLVYFERGLRLVITTANFIRTDWEDKTQGVWVMDFPCKMEYSILNDFERDLIEYVKALGLEESLVDEYDFSKVNVDLITSIPGYYKTKASVHKYGHMKLRRLIDEAERGLAPSKVTCQFSSMGSLTENWVFEEFAKSLRTTKYAFSIVWPTVQDVRTSLQGWEAGACIPCAQKNMKPFLRPLLHAWAPPSNIRRDRAMPHCKTYVGYDVESSKIRWIVLSSANLSKAAWGALQKKDTQLMIRSFEIGVFFHQKKYRAASSFSCTPGKGLLGQGKNQDIQKKFIHFNTEASNSIKFPIPYDLPPKRKYNANDVPWVWDVQRLKPDVLGKQYIV